MNKEYNVYASRALLRAEEDAKSCRQKYVGTEHLVLGLLSEEESLAGPGADGKRSDLSDIF